VLCCYDCLLSYTNQPFHKLINRYPSVLVSILEEPHDPALEAVDLDHQDGRELLARHDTYFSSRRLRDLALRRRYFSHSDLWESVRLVFDILGREGGHPRLALLASAACTSLAHWIVRSLARGSLTRSTLTVHTRPHSTRHPAKAPATRPNRRRLNPQDGPRRCSSTGRGPDPQTFGRKV
jgi:hypothetical protein